MEQIVLAYGLTRESVTAIMMTDKKSKVKVRSPDGDTDFFDIVAGELQAEVLAPYLFIICLNYVLRTLIDLIKENGLTLEKARSRRYHIRNISKTPSIMSYLLLSVVSLNTTFSL